MENAVDAIKIAFAIFVLVMALSIGMYMFDEAKRTSDVVLQSSDVTEYIEYVNTIEGTTMIEGDRVVGLETIIPTLYKYYKENYTVVFLNRDGTPMTLYKTKTNPNNWSTGYGNKYYSNNKAIEVCSFDVDEETRRREPWTGNTDYYKLNLDCFLSGQTFKAPSGNTEFDYNYGINEVHGWTSSKSFVEQFKNSKFRESIGQYQYSDITSQVSDNTISGSGITNTAPKTKRVIVYTLWE